MTHVAALLSDRHETPDCTAEPEVEWRFCYLADAENDDERQDWRAQIIVAYLPFADRIARRFAGRGEPSEDLTQVARVGLIKAIDRYDPAKGSFLPFAFTTISGEVRRYFRDNTWGMHVPRGIKDKHRRVRRAIDPLSQRLGRAPTAAELASELEIAPEDVLVSIDASSAYHPASLDAALPARNSVGHNEGAIPGADDPRYNAVEDTLALNRLIMKLSRRQQVVLKLRFCDCLTQTQIAERLGISQVHVCRLLSTTLQHLRAELSDDQPQIA